MECLCSSDGLNHVMFPLFFLVATCIQVKHFSGAKFKSFSTREEAQAFVQNAHSSLITDPGGTGHSNANPTTTRDDAPCNDNNKDPQRGTRSSPRGHSKVSERKKKTAVAKDVSTTTKRKASEDAKDLLLDSDLSGEPKKWVKRKKTAEDDHDHDHWKVSIMFDGGSRGNPGNAGAGALVAISSKDVSSSRKTASFAEKKKIRVRYYLGRATNNEGTCD